MLGAASAGKDDADDDSFSIGLGVLSPSYRQKIGPDGNTKVDFNQEKDGFSFSVSSGEPNAKTASGAVKPYSHITFSQQFQDPAAAKKHASAGGRRAAASGSAPARAIRGTARTLRYVIPSSQISGSEYNAH
ncbi:hypothetical protein MRX96_056714 [Rhipicephalus microplus]